jgi:protein-disulfide isomerase
VRTDAGFPVGKIRPRADGADRLGTHAGRVMLQSRRLLLAVIAVATLLGAGVIAVSATQGESDPVTPASSLPSQGLFEGIPQSGIVLGSSSARVTLVEFADLQCPYCAQFATQALPTVIRDYVRTGRVKLVFQGLAFVGLDSKTALRAVLAAGLQNRAWDLLDALYRRQGAENSGWVTRKVLREAARESRGLEQARLFRDARAPAVGRQLAQAQRYAEAAGVHGTPTFFVGPSGGTLRHVELTSLSAEALRPALDAALGQ